jgi:hypothetical protein
MRPQTSSGCHNQTFNSNGASFYNTERAGLILSCPEFLWFTEINNLDVFFRVHASETSIPKQASYSVRNDNFARISLFYDIIISSYLFRNLRMAKNVHV